MKLDYVALVYNIQKLRQFSRIEQIFPIGEIPSGSVCLNKATRIVLYDLHIK